MKARRALKKNGKFFVHPPKNPDHFKQLFRETVAAGAGLPLDAAGFPDGHWTPERLSTAISEIDANPAGVDLRTVQHWFEDNDKGIGAENIRWLARIFGCGDPQTTSEWQSALRISNVKLASRRRAKRDVNLKTLPVRDGKGLESKKSTADFHVQQLAIKEDKQSTDKPLGLGGIVESLFNNNATLNLPTAVWAGCVTLGVLAYILDVYHVTYSPLDGLNKQVGLFWAPNWTLLEMVLLPMFLVIVVNILEFWKTEGRPAVLGFMSTDVSAGEWIQRVNAFSYSHGANFIICFGVVFVVQWSGVHLQALLHGDVGDLMVDWNVIAILRPEVISAPQAITLSMLAFLYTGTICFLFLSGLILLYTVMDDFVRMTKQLGTRRSLVVEKSIRMISTTLLCNVFRCAVLGVLISTCIKLQAAYLLTDSENIVRWLVDDALWALGSGGRQAEPLASGALAHFTSFILLFATSSVFLTCFTQIYRALKLQELTDSRSFEVAQASAKGTTFKIPWLQMLSVFFGLCLNFVLIGQFAGFSILLAIALSTAIYSLVDPFWGRAKSVVSDHQQVTTDA